METFDFDYHSMSTKYPETGTKMKLGGSYNYTSTPTEPPARTITLHFADNAMRIHMISRGVPDLTKEPQTNWARLEAFYKAHEMHKSFIYQHELYGDLVVKFAKPLEMPQLTKGGWLPSFTLDLEEQP